MRRFLWLPLVAVLTAIPAPAGAVTIDQIVSLAHAGVTDAVILALIDRDKTIFPIEPEQIVTLQRDGLSEAVILAMLKSGREEGDQAARADAASNAAAILASLAPGPETVIVGHGPEVPNTAHPNGFYSGAPASAYSPASAYYGSFPSAYSSFRFRSSSRRATAPAVGVHAPLMCFAQVPAGSGLIPMPGMITACPAMMQPSARR
jgi:hypothetical protein